MEFCRKHNHATKLTIVKVESETDHIIKLMNKMENLEEITLENSSRQKANFTSEIVQQTIRSHQNLHTFNLNGFRLNDNQLANLQNQFAREWDINVTRIDLRNTIYAYYYPDPFVNLYLKKKELIQ